MSTEVYLFRHGETVWNLENEHLIGGRSNHTPLTVEGMIQSRQLGRYLLNENIFPTSVHSSPAIRTIMTGGFCLGEMGVNIAWQFDDDLQEMCQGRFEGQPKDKIYTKAEIVKRETLGLDYRLDDAAAESMRQTGQRKRRWFDTKIEAGAPESPRVHFVFAHGMATRCLVATFTGWGPQEIWDNKTGNTCITKLSSFDGSAWNLDSYAETPHLQ